MERHWRRPDRRSFGEVLLHTFLGVVTGAVLGGLCFFGLAFLLGVGSGGGGWHPLIGSHLVMIPFVWMIPGGALVGGVALNCWMACENRARRSGPRSRTQDGERTSRTRNRLGRRSRSLR